MRTESILAGLSLLRNTIQMCLASRRFKMGIIYLVVALVGILFGAMSIFGLADEEK
jgi:hypothetical protein